MSLKIILDTCALHYHEPPFCKKENNRLFITTLSFDARREYSIYRCTISSALKTSSREVPPFHQLLIFVFLSHSRSYSFFLSYCHSVLNTIMYTLQRCTSALIIPYNKLFQCSFNFKQINRCDLISLF